MFLLEALGSIIAILGFIGFESLGYGRVGEFACWRLWHLLHLQYYCDWGGGEGLYTKTCTVGQLRGSSKLSVEGAKYQAANDTLWPGSSQFSFQFVFQAFKRGIY